jgi:hypothetical protein
MSSLTFDPAASQRVRLHVTPFNSELLDKIIPPSVQPLASNITFHAVQTFPERGFGYVELPVMEAQKLKKKLNGSTLKGAKVRIEDAKPEKKRKVQIEATEEDDDGKMNKKVKKEKQKREEGVLPGHELEQGRRVKRGWTDAEGKGKKNGAEANGTATGEGRKLRFKTTLPPNASQIPEKGKDKVKKKQKDKEGSKKREKMVVEEFKKSKKSRDVSLPAGQGQHGDVHYEDDKGWVDQDGQVVEAERVSKKSKRQKRSQEPNAMPTVDEENDESMAVDLPNVNPTAQDEEAGSSAVQPESSDAAAQDEQPSTQKEVHPLEAIFKRPTTSASESSKPRPTPIDTSFSFFNSGADEDDEEDAGVNLPPQTPHTRRDLEWRSLRSAAPTPDTAAIGRRFSFPVPQDSEMDDEGDADDHEMEDADHVDATAGAASRPVREESALRKRHYEIRGEFNRTWKKRRREERKQTRQRENRRFSQKVA